MECYEDDGAVIYDSVKVKCVSKLKENVKKGEVHV